MKIDLGGESHGSDTRTELHHGWEIANRKRTERSDLSRFSVYASVARKRRPACDGSCVEVRARKALRARLEMIARGKLLPELLPLGLGKLAMKADLSRKEPRRPSHRRPGRSATASA